MGLVNFLNYYGRKFQVSPPLIYILFNGFMYFTLPYSNECNVLRYIRALLYDDDDENFSTILNNDFHQITDTHQLI